MTLFSRKSVTKNGEVKFVGVQIPLQVNSYLTLYALAAAGSKSAIIQEQLELWKEEHEVTESIGSLIEKISTKAIKTFKDKIIQNETSLKKFLFDVKKELSTKGIDNDSIILILEAIRNGAK